MLFLAAYRTAGGARRRERARRGDRGGARATRSCTTTCRAWTTTTCAAAARPCTACSASGGDGGRRRDGAAGRALRRSTPRARSGSTPMRCGAIVARADARVGRGRNDRRPAARPRGRGTAARARRARADPPREDRRADSRRRSTLGGVAAGASPTRARGARRVTATAIGLAFQIADDVLDVTATTDRLGKTAGRDLELAQEHLSRAARASTGARARAERWSTRGARRCDAAGLLIDRSSIALAHFVVERES